MANIKSRDFLHRRLHKEFDSKMPAEKLHEVLEHFGPQTLEASGLSGEELRAGLKKLKAAGKLTAEDLNRFQKWL